jgi:hypothetical protein
MEDASQMQGLLAQLPPSATLPRGSLTGKTAMTVRRGDVAARELGDADLLGGVQLAVSAGQAAQDTQRRRQHRWGIESFISVGVQSPGRRESTWFYRLVPGSCARIVGSVMCSSSFSSSTLLRITLVIRSSSENGRNSRPWAEPPNDVGTTQR